MRVKRRLLTLIAFHSLLNFAAGAPMNKSKWMPTECAPAGYPAKIVAARLQLVDKTSVAIPKAFLVNNGWGTIGSLHAVGSENKAVPAQLAIAWLSLTENKFYSGVFDLPAEKIGALFERKIADAAGAEQPGYDTVVVGMAPGGSVAVWLRGDELVTEVFFGKAAATVVDWKLVDNGELSREKFIEDILQSELTEGQLAGLRRESVPMGQWPAWTAKTRLQPVLVGPRKVTRLTIEYWNAEREVVDLARGGAIETKERALPENINVEWEGAGGARRVSRVSFDEEEIFGAMAKIKALKVSEPVELRLEISGIDRSIGVFLRAGEYLFEFKRARVESIR